MTKINSTENERRSSVRNNIYMPASIVDPRRGEIASCVVENLSRSGTKLSCDHAIALPPIFWLRIRGDANLRYCSAKWRRDQCIGIDFTADRAVRAIEEEAKNVRQRMSLHNYPHSRGVQLRYPSGEKSIGSA